MTRLNMTLRPRDTWFFRESRPIDATGRVESLFPPPMRSVMGMLRTLIGRSVGLRDWRAFAAGNPVRHRRSNAIDLKGVMGSAEGFGALRLRGPWLRLEDRRFVPAPALFIAARFFSARPGESSIREIETLRFTWRGVENSEYGRLRLPIVRGPGGEIPSGLWVEELTLRVGTVLFE